MVYRVGELMAATTYNIPPTIVRWFGGKGYIPQYEDEQGTLVGDDAAEGGDAAEGDENEESDADVFPTNLP